MQSYFSNKVVAITGGSDGIGKALVQQLLLWNAKVSTCGRSADKLEALSDSSDSKNLFTVQADVSKAEDCKKFIRKTIEQFSTIDILINNAGVSMRAELLDADPEVFRQIMDINYFGTVNCTKFALEHIIKQKGDIVAISSIAGFRGLPGRSGYSASKFAVNGWLEAVRVEMMPLDVNVLCVCPGFTSSNIRKAALNATGESHGETPVDENKLMTAEECAHHTLKAIAARKKMLVLTFTGKRAVFMNKFFPRWTDKLTRKFFYKNGKLVR